MKKLKKFLSLGLAALTAGCMAGCDSSSPAPGAVPIDAVLEAGSTSVELQLPEKLNIHGKGLFTLTLKNTSDAGALTVEFVTEEDQKYTSFKRFELPLHKTGDFEDFTLDLSGAYGWLGHLTGLRVTAQGLNEGNIRLQSMAAREGGENYIRGLSVGQPYEYLSARDRMTVKNIQYGPDGLVGSWRDADGTIHYLGSSSSGGVSGAFLTTGTPDDPFKTMHYTGKRVNGVDWTELGYCSVAQIIKEPTTGMLIGISHLERHYENKTKYVGTLGLSVSRDNGESWTFLGEFISHDIIPGPETPAESRDIGNGTVLMDDEYLYLFLMDYHESDHSGGISVARVKLTELFEKTLADELPQAYKYKDGQWNEPGWGGDFTSVVPEDISPNFFYLSYNTVLKKYIMVTCQFTYYDDNDGDILLLVSDDMLDWSNAQRQWIATGYHCEQYPVIFSDAENCQTESGETFYIYWCDWNAKDDDNLGLPTWQLIWTSARYMCCKVTVTG